MISYIKLQNTGTSYIISYVDDFGTEKIIPNITSIAYDHLQNLVAYVERLKSDEERQIDELTATVAVKEAALTTTIAEKEAIAQTANRYKQFLLETELTPEQMLELIDIYPDWVIATAYVIDDVVKYNEKLYKVIQAHTSQEDWTPDITPALFVSVVPENVIPEFIQPTGVHDAYHIGDQVTFNGETYESLIDGNVYSPMDYPQGWVLV